MTDRLAIVNATALTADNAATIVRDATLVVGHDGAIRTLVSGNPHHDAPDVIDARGGIVMPGLINAHTHLAMTLFRGLADDVTLEDFLARLMPAEFAVLSAEAVFAGTQLAALESLRGGITTALDMYYLPEAIVEVARTSRMRIHTGPTLLEFDGPERLGFDARLAWAKRWLEHAQSTGDTASLWLGPHSTYLMGEEHLRRTAVLARDLGADAVVFGCLLPDGALDLSAIETLLDACDGFPAVFHRAFDVCQDLPAALEILAELGFERILTSGGAPSVIEALDPIAALVQQAAGRLDILPGGGIKASQVAEIVRRTGVNQIHLSARTLQESAMTWRRPEIPMGADSVPGEYERRIADIALITAARQALAERPTT
jgi:copper homeostasis protein CutC